MEPDATTTVRDEDAHAVLESYRPLTFARRLATFGELDEHFTTNWLTHMSRLLRRDQLSRRKRLLVFTGQFTMLGRLEALEETLEAALADDIDPREPLEVILQCYVYAGESAVEPAAEVFLDVVRRRGLLAQVKATQPPADVTRRGRSLEEERSTWSAEDRDDPRLEGLLERHGWESLSPGLQLRPGHVVNVMTTLNALDADFGQIWLEATYEGMYSRGVLDQATRLLCVVGNCLAVGETHQSRRHMRGALRQGATPREVMEVIVQSVTTAGHPNLMPMAFDDLITILDDEGQLESVVAADEIEQVRRITAARTAQRQGTTDLPTQV